MMILLQNIPYTDKITLRNEYFTIILENFRIFLSKMDKASR